MRVDLMDVTPAWWLVSVFPDGSSIADGPHDTKRQAAKAKKIIQACGLDNGNRRYFVLRVEECPESAGRINEKAAAVCKMMVDRMAERKR